MIDTTSKGTVIHLGEQRLQGIYFVELPKEDKENLPYRKHQTMRNDIIHVSTDDMSRNAHIRNALIELISKAKHKVLFCSFLFADDKIVGALCEAAERLHGGVYILTALDKHLRAEIIDEPDSDVDKNTTKLQERARRHDEHLGRLAYAGAWLRSVEDCHAKFCVVDDICAVVTSANATQEAYESNPEDGFILLNNDVAKEFGRLFSYIWRHLATLESVPGSRLDVHSCKFQVPTWSNLTGESKIRPVATLRTTENSLLSAAIEVIDRAQKHISIATYSFMNMKNHPIGDALMRALERKVTIDLLVQPRNHIDEQRLSLAWLLNLSPEQVRIFGHRRTHTKSIVADGQTVLLWTGNLESRHGWLNGIEVGIVIDDKSAASAVSAWTKDVMLRHTHVAFNSPSMFELVTAGQLSALKGEWVLYLSPPIQTEFFVDALSGNTVELLEMNGKSVLRCGKELLFDITIDLENRRINVLKRYGKNIFVGSTSKGWLAESVVSIARQNTPLNYKNKNSRK